MRLLFLTHCYPSNSSDIRGGFFLELISSLQKSGVNVQIVTPSWGNDKVSYDLGANKEEIVRFPCGCDYLGDLRLWNPINWIRIVGLMLGWKKALRQLKARGENWDCVIAAWGFPAGLLLQSAMFSKCRKIIWWLGTDVHKFDNKLFRQFLRYIAKSADENWASGSSLGKRLEGLIKKPVRFAPLVNAASFIDPAKRERKAVPTVISIGRLHKVKGFDVAIQAVKVLLDSGLKFHYKIIGDGKEKNNLVQSLKGYEHNVNLLGYLSPDLVKQELKKADCLLISSRNEALPVVFFEALQANIPVVSTDVGDVANCLKGKRIGVVSEENNAITLAESLKKFFLDELQADQNVALKILQEYSVDQTVRMVLSLKDVKI